MQIENRRHSFLEYLIGTILGEILILCTVAHFTNID